MKKSILILITVLFSFVFISAQTNYLEEAPLGNTTSTNRAPNGTSSQAYFRHCSLVLASELNNLPANTNISSFGFTLTAGTNTGVTGNFTLYLQNTSNTTYQKGTSWTNILTGMTSVYASTMTIPNSAGTVSVMLSFSPSFTYSGGGLYVAYDWSSTGPFGSVPATYIAEGSALNPGSATGAAGTAGPAPATLISSNYRPAFLFGAVNTLTNDIQVVSIIAPGKVPNTFNTPHTIAALVKNASNATRNTINVSLNVGGPNPFNNTQTITTLAAGAATLVSFASFNPQALGTNNIFVSVPGDQYNPNNTMFSLQDITCDTWAQNPSGTYSGTPVGFGGGTGILATPISNSIAATLTGLRAGISSDLLSVNNSIYGVLMDGSGNILATTSTFVITSAMLGSQQIVTFTPPQAVSANTAYYIGFAQTAGGVPYSPAATLPSAYVDPNLYVTTGINGGVLTPVGQNYGYFDLEAIYEPNVLVLASASPATMCQGSSITITVSGISSYTWSTAAGFLNNLATFTDSPASTITYSITGTNSVGCIGLSKVTVTVNPLPLVSISNLQPAVCLGSAATLTANGAVSYTWNTGAATPVLSDIPATATVYIVSGASTNGCVNTASAAVTVNSVTLNISGNAAICTGQTSTLTASGASSYLWNTTFPFSSYTVSPTTTAVYTVTGTDNTINCTVTKTVSLVVNPLPVLSASAIYTAICYGRTASLSASGAATYTWAGTGISGSPFTESISAVPFILNTLTVYSVTGVSTEGCSRTSSIGILVVACEGIASVENSGSLVSVYPNPNNGQFTVSFTGVPDKTEVEIYNALGTLVKKQAVSEEQTLVDLTTEPAGVYFVYVTGNAKKSIVSKIVRQ